MEEWRDIPGYEGLYQVSDLGRVRGVDRVLPSGRTWRGKLIAQKSNKSHHRSVRLCNDTDHKFHGVHRLVLMAFVGPCPPEHEGAHNNGIPSDNRPSNLRWDTHAGNQADKLIHGTAIIGERNHLARLTEGDIRRAFVMRRQGALLAEIAAELRVTAANVSQILQRKTWKHVEI